MASKRSNKTINNNAKKAKNCRKALTLEMKLDILKKYDSGKRQVDLCKTFDLAESTVRTIIRNKEKILECSKLATPLNAMKLNRSRPAIMIEMEGLLNLFIEENIKLRIPLNFAIIQQKAMSLYENLKKNLPEGSSVEHFIASKGWFERFRKRSNLQNMSLCENLEKNMSEGTNSDPLIASISWFDKFFMHSNLYNATEEMSNDDIEITEKFKNVFLDIIEKGGYTPQQVFNIDESGLFWKRLPKRTFISEEKFIPGFKTSQDRLTLLLGGNAAGDFKLKPVLVYHTETPKALKGYVKSRLPIIWKSNKTAWVTRTLFQDWFSDHFCSAVEQYCVANKLSNKVLLILDNALGHSIALDELSANVRVLFIPLNITSLIQPMNQGIITAFKTYYIRNIFSQAVNTVNEGENALTLEEFWKSYNIKHAIDNIASAWQEIQQKTINASWRKLWKDCVQDYQSFDIDEVRNNIILLGRDIDLNETELEDIQELIENQNDDLSNDELMEIAAEHAKALEEFEEIENEFGPPKMMTIEGMTEAFQKLDECLSYFKDNDVDMERSHNVCRVIENAMTCYREIYKSKKVASLQFSLDSFVSSKKDQFSTSAAIQSLKDESIEEKLFFQIGT